MSLSPEFFAEIDNRNKQRDINGVSIKEAEGDLGLIDSSIYPVAIETAEWLYKNWTLEKFFQLSNYSKFILLKIIEVELKKSDSTQDLVWHKIIEKELISHLRATKQPHS